MGRATATLLAKRGVKVIATDIALERAQDTVAEILSAGGVASAFKGDISLESDWIAIVQHAVAFAGSIDILHNNAADLRPEIYGKDSSIGIEAMDVELWDAVMAVNLRGTMLGCKHVIPVMSTQGSGSIINVSSNAADSGQDTSMAYASSKAAINVLTKYVATAYGARGIRCNAISPGLVVSDEMKATLGQDLLAVFERNILLPFVGVPNDVAEVVAFLASDRSRYITGQILAVDGGLTSHAPYLAELRDLP